MVGLPAKFITELVKTLQSWTRGYAPLKELRMVAGKLSWMGGILPRCKWTTSVCYAVLTQQLKEEEENKAGGKRESRDRHGLFPVKRLEMTRRWLIDYLEAAMVRPMRKIYLGPKTSTDIVLTTDASPEAVGAVLSLSNKPVAALFSYVEDWDAENLVFEKGQSSSQAVLEVMAILVALKHWGSRFSSMRVRLMIQSDSTAALALTKRLAGSSPGINFLGSELSLLLETLNVDELEAIHIPGKANVECDFLSRPSTWPNVSLPSALRGLEVESVAGRGEGCCKLPTPKESPSLWGSKEATAVGSHWDAVK